jgi:protocatechuate 3,4-dioxygenase beta subunit
LNELPTWTRRDWLRLFSASALAWLSGRWVAGGESTSGRPGGISLSPELTEGPYYIDLERIRRDITEGKTGVPLRLRVTIVDGASGRPVPNAALDVWHCDAQGVYSGFESHLPPGGPGAMGDQSTYFDGSQADGFSQFLFGNDDQPDGPLPGGAGFHHQPDNKLTFLRGVQVTDSKGVAEIDTIFPGWYMGRATHIHVRVHIGGTVADGRYRGGHISHTGQIFFPEELTSLVYQVSAYHKSEGGRTALQEDGIFVEGGSQMTPVALVDAARLEAGLVSEPQLVINPKASPRENGPRG